MTADRCPNCLRRVWTRAGWVPAGRVWCHCATFADVSTSTLEADDGRPVELELFPEMTGAQRLHANAVATSSTLIRLPFGSAS
jgi:hypothetical protein